jgi:fimbrial chaperone protein
MGRKILALIVALAATSPVVADSLEIGPTRIQMIGIERTATLTIRNSNAAPANIQVRAMDWSQPDGIDAYTPSGTLLASPPQAPLAPGGSQTIRLVIEKLPATATERAFRLVIDQIPSEQTAGGAGVRTAIRALVPVFVTASMADRPKLRWGAIRSGTKVTLTATNDGAAHERLIDGRLSTGGTAVGQPIEGYVLASSQRRWTIIGVPANARSLALAGEGEFGQVRADVSITP